MEEYNVQGASEIFMKALLKERQNLKKLNVMVLGKTGVGKSTLINNVFNEQLAEAGVGKPVTTRIRQYSKENFPLTVYDTPGLELSGENAIDELLKEVTDVITRGINSGDIQQAIHCIWYCVSATSHRFEDAEKDFINRFLQNTSATPVPVILVLTQAYSKKEAKQLKDAIDKENLGVAQIVPVLASDFEFDEECVAKAYGLDKLTEVMSNVIPDTLKNTLVSVQRANLKMKINKAQVIVATSATAACATGAVPIPFSDAALLVPEQATMLAGITAVFGLPIEKSTIISVISATIGTMGATVLGKSIVSSLLKFIPVVGSAVGGTISGSVAAAITAALGEAYIFIMAQIAKGEMKITDLKTKEGKDKIAAIFKQKLSLKRNEKGTAIANQE